MKRIAIAAGAAAFTLAGASAANASGGGYINQAVESLNSGASYSAPGVDGQSLATYDGTAVGVVALPADAFANLNPANLASEIFEEVEGYETVIVVDAESSSSSIYGVAPTEASETVWGIIGDNADSGTPVESLAGDSADLIAAVGTSNTAVEAEAFNPAPLFGFGGALILGAAAAAGVTLFFRSRRRKAAIAVVSKFDVNPTFQSELKTFSALARRHAANRYPTARVMASVLKHLNDLFIRIESKGASNAKRMAEVEYKNAIENLNNALGEGYYMDISANPNYYPDAEARLREVEAALTAIDQQVLTNIRQISTAKDLDFRVALDTIIRSSDTVDATKLIDGKPQTSRFTR